MDKFCFALYQLEHFTERPAEYKEEIFKLLFDYADISTFSPEERIQYELDMTTEADRINQLNYAHDKGVQEGREEGREEGKKEMLRIIAERLRKQGLSCEEIKRILPDEES